MRPVCCRAAIIALTASVVSETDTLQAAGADALLLKPYREEELLNAIGGLLNLTYIPVQVQSGMRERTDSAPLPELLKRVPAGLRNKLRDALLEARAEEVERLAEDIRPHTEPATEQILALTRNFQYEDLVSILDGLGVE